METTNATKVGEVLYIQAPKKKFLPAYVYYLLEYHECKGVCFGNSKHIYKQKDLKTAKDWDEVTQNESK